MLYKINSIELLLFFNIDCNLIRQMSSGEEERAGLREKAPLHFSFSLPLSAFSWSGSPLQSTSADTKGHLLLLPQAPGPWAPFSCACLTMLPFETLLLPSAPPQTPPSP